MGAFATGLTFSEDSFRDSECKRVKQEDTSFLDTDWRCLGCRGDCTSSTLALIANILDPVLASLSRFTPYIIFRNMVVSCLMSVRILADFSNFS